MDKDGVSPARRKLRFAPKAPPKPKTTVPKSEATNDVEDKEAARAQFLLGRFNENQTRQRPKVEKKCNPSSALYVVALYVVSSAQIAFGPGAPSQTLLRTYGTRSGDTSGRNATSIQRSPDDNDGQIVAYLPSTSKEDMMDICPSDAIEASAPNMKREYREPWDYNHSYYPITLPLRRPYSGDPELLDQAEFVEAAGKEYDENTINTASDLGLLEEGDTGKMFLFQLPANLPMVKRPASTKGKEKAEISVPSQHFGASQKGCQLQELQGGYMGKMLVYKSGAVKLKLGEMLYNITSFFHSKLLGLCYSLQISEEGVSPGSDCAFAQDVAMVNTTKKHCCMIGELGKRVVVDPDIETVLDSVIDLD
ncbi:RNA polymerase III Rpc4 [Corchorus olitorius]|uniref:RNA polymerase III Rpc4 n=1 Tax=Corchorus olitorius TaxID=93759 RepID=A0A1R3JTJ2_9ROSI|nr:RNA polymerase III Rpc4 [Corchorus olitorius]